MSEKRKVCSKCGVNAFRIIETTSCSKCRCNGVYNEEEEEYTHDMKTIKTMEKEDPRLAERTQCWNEGECDMGSNHDAGCWVFECINCDCSDMIPRVEN